MALKKHARHLMKRCCNILAGIVVLLPVACVWVEKKVFSSGSIYLFWAQLLALIPGKSGKFVRRAYYAMVMPGCGWDWEIGFGSYFSQPMAEIGEGVYIGSYAILGKVTIGKGSMIGSRVSIPSGNAQHQHDETGSLTPTTDENLQRIRIGSNVWIGEAAVIMADVGDGCIVAGGSVIGTPVPNHLLVAGNPARAVKKLRDVE